MKKLYLLSLALTYVLTSCGLTQPKPTLEVEIMGLPRVSESSSGQASPQFYEITVQRIFFEDASTSELINFDLPASEVFRIIDRPQIVFEAPLADYEGLSLSSFGIEFDPTFVAAGRVRKNHELEFSTAIVEQDTDISIAKNRSLKLTVYFLWLNTVTVNEDKTDESLTPADIETSLRDVRM